MSERRSSEVVKRKELVARLNPTCQRAFKAAGDSAKLRGNPYVELVHFVEQLALLERGDVQHDPRRGRRRRLAAGRRHDRGHRRAAARRHLDLGLLRPHLRGDPRRHELRRAAGFGDETVRSAYILLGALKVPALDGLLGTDQRASSTRSIPTRSARGSTACSPARSRASPRRRRERRAAGRAAARARAATRALAKYATDLTERARAGKIDPVVGRDPEIRQIVDVLMRRRQNNPILTGEAGVGKTAVVEGFALRIAAGRRAADAAEREPRGCSTSG